MAQGFFIDSTRSEYGTWTFGWWLKEGMGGIQNVEQAFMLQLPDFLVQLSSLRVRDVVTTPAVALAYYQLRSNGRIRERLANGPSQIGTWLSDPTLADLFEARMVQVSGDPFQGPLPVGQWGNLASNREWGVTRNSIGTTRAVGRIEIRRVGGTVVLAQANIIARARVRP
jgi:hypothetical protein